MTRQLNECPKDALFLPKTRPKLASLAGSRASLLLGAAAKVDCVSNEAQLMIRRSILLQAGSAALVLLLAGMGPAARAQDVATQERLDRLERDLSMLQRQVYRGGAAPPGAEAGGNSAVDLQVRMDRLEQQMRDLTGRVEDETNDVRQLRQRLEQVNSDLDVRLGSEQGRAPAPPPAPRPPAAYAGPPPPPYAESPGLPAYGRPPPPPPGYAELRPPGPDAAPAAAYGGPAQLRPPPAGSGETDALRPPAADALPAGSVLAQYNAAFGLLRQADYAAAEEALRGFVREHPHDRLVSNAQYWLGESYRKRGQYMEAAAAFADGYKRFPKGQKATDSLLGLGRSLADAGKKHEACVAFAQLDHEFPHQSSAIKDRASQEKKKLECPPQ
jgi:tol-pal system protein YbgF